MNRGFATFRPETFGRTVDPQNRIILHIDFDSFFASVEQQYHPEFRNKPLGVTATNGRSCIIAASREAKKMGVVGGSRTYDAFKVCPHILLTGAHFSLYWEISKHFIRICREFSPTIEVFSLDELFMDATLTAHLYGGILPMVKKIKEKIRKELGEYITVSVGISYNKLLAKLGSGMKKPNGFFVITPTNLDSVYSLAKLTDICDIGPRIEKRLNMMGIFTLLQLRRTPLHNLIAEFGNVEGHFLEDIGRGIDARPVATYLEAPETKSVGRSYCLPENTYDKRVVVQNLYELSEELGNKLRKLNKKTRTIGYYLRGSRDWMFRKTYHEPIDYGDAIFSRFFDSLGRYRFLKQDGYIRQINLWVGNLVDTDSLTLPLFPSGKTPRLQATIDTLNDRFGSHTVRNGFLLYAPKLKTVPNGFMGDRLLRAKLAQNPEL